jgi:pyruvate dehydrogenase phosphatase
VTEKGLHTARSAPVQAGPFVGSTPPGEALAFPSQPTLKASALEKGAESARRALVVQNDEFFAADLAGEEPVSKEVDRSGRLVLEMLTAEQATQKLRRHEESYLVKRGRGVVRYDVTQLASNSPIEDDHVEKIIEVPGYAPPLQPGRPNSDWMFWGGFDGHRHVSEHPGSHFQG